MLVASPQQPEITIETGFDNANPATAGMVQFDQAGVCEIRQQLEANAPAGYSFHFNIALLNASARAALVALKIVWAEPGFDYCRDYMYIGYDAGKAWRMLSISASNAVTALKVVVPPGRHLLCCTPKFDVGDYLALLERFAGRGPFERIDVGRSAEGRPLACLRCGNPAGRRVVVTTRAHGYETAGAYCMAGWFEFAAEHGRAGSAALDRLNVHFFPMINPDAVAHGNCCLAPTGVNFGRELAVRGGEDAGAQALADFICGLCPACYLDMHNNTGPHLADSFRSGDAGLAEQFRARAPDRSRDQKFWNINQVPAPAGYLPRLCRERFGTVPIVTEFPWYTRLPADMREHGRQFFETLLPLLADWPGPAGAMSGRQ